MIERALAALDDTLHAKARLGIVTLLLEWGGGDFSALKQALAMTDGNLGAHLRVLEDAGHLDVEKSFEGRKPRTRYRVTPQGRKAYRVYLDSLEQLLRAAPTRRRRG